MCQPLEKLKVELGHDPAFSLPGVDPGELKVVANRHVNTLFQCQRADTTVSRAANNPRGYAHMVGHCSALQGFHRD